MAPFSRSYSRNTASLFGWSVRDILKAPKYTNDSFPFLSILQLVISLIPKAFIYLQSQTDTPFRVEPRIVVTQLSLVFGNVVSNARYECLVGVSFYACLLLFLGQLLLFFSLNLRLCCKEVCLFLARSLGQVFLEVKLGNDTDCPDWLSAIRTSCVTV